jgi:hypothetical protein
MKIGLIKNIKSNISSRIYEIFFMERIGEDAQQISGHNCRANCK